MFQKYIHQVKSYPSRHKSRVFHFQWVALLPVYVGVPQLHLKSKIKNSKRIVINNNKKAPVSAPLGFLWVAHWGSSCSIPYERPPCKPPTTISLKFLHHLVTASYSFATLLAFM